MKTVRKDTIVTLTLGSHLVEKITTEHPLMRDVMFEKEIVLELILNHKLLNMMPTCLKPPPLYFVPMRRIWRNLSHIVCKENLFNILELSNVL